MKPIHKIISVLSAAALSLSLSAALPESLREYNTMSAYASSNRRVISDLDEFLKFAEECRIDSASKGLEVVLNADIYLAGREFFGIPIFCGTFDGNGHMISGLSIRGSASEIGLFRHVERGAVIKNLKVSGSIAPGGSGSRVGGIAGVNKGTLTDCEYSGIVSGSDRVGGIAGENGESGVISGCSSSAVISAEDTAGGIVGNNLGVVIDCSNSGNVDAVYTDPEISADDAGLDDLTAANVIGRSDIGGVAGYSSGIIQRCSNSGTVGYQHTGYNIGGVVGRQCGLMNACTNTGHVYGRKDIGGIAGQMEPYRSIEFSQDTAQRLSAEMDILSKCVDKLISDARGSGNKLNSEIQTLTNQMNAAQKNADTITDRAESVFNGYSDGINEILARVDIALDGISPALADLDAALELFGEFSDKCSEALKDLEQAGDYSGGAIDAARDALKDIDKAIPDIEAGIRDIAKFVREIQKSLGDPDKIKQSLKNITSSLDKVTDNMRDISAAADRLNSAFTELSNWLNGADWRKLKDSVTALSECMSDVLTALGDVSGAVSDITAAIDSGELQNAFSELNSASAALGRAAAKLAAALQGGTIPDADDLRGAADELQKAADALQNASDHFNAAVDPDEMKTALDELQAAAKELQRALDNASKAADDMSSALSKIINSSVPEDTTNTASAQIKIILDSVGDMSGDLADINSEVRDILNEIDASGLSEAMKSLGDAAERIANAADSISGAGDDIDKAAEALGNAVDSLTSASSKAGDAADIMSEVSEKLSSAVKQLEDVTRTLADKPEVRFPALDESFTSAADSLSLNMKAMISTLSRIGNTANSESSIILDDIQAVSDSLERITEIFRDAYKDLMSDENNERRFSEDISESEGNGSTRQGRAFSCVNSGEVEGDVNIGGITGAMAIEFDLDPEDDIAQNGDRSINFSYNVMNVIESCENFGRITAKKNYCGGIVGKMDMGLVKNSRSSGSVSGTSGSYVGGIAGYSSAKLRGCAAKVSLSGTSYIGGIAGEGGIITNCLAISDITEFSEKIGALAGYVDFEKENIEISDNYFVDRGVAGIDRVSYTGIAEPISYDEFARLTGGFADIVIEFTADGDSLGKLTVPYGGSVNASDIPEIPKRSGFFSKWGEFDFQNVTFPYTISAEYIPYITAIESAVKDENGLALVIANGTFDDNAEITVETESSSVFAPEGGELRQVTLDYKHYDDSESLKLRFLRSGNNPQLMQYVNGAWKHIDFTENGSYLIVDAPASDGEPMYFCVMSGTVNTTLIIVIAAAAAVAVINIVLITILIKRRKKAKKKEEQNNT